MNRYSLLTRKRRTTVTGFLKGPSSSVPNIDSNQLHAFVVLAGELNFTRAADRLHLTESKLSRQITDLEKELQSQLFTRDQGRGVKLTNAGRVIVEEVRSALLKMERAFQRAQEKSDIPLTIEQSPDAHQALPTDSQRHLRQSREPEGE